MNSCFCNLAVIRSRTLAVATLIALTPAIAIAQQSLIRIHEGIVSEYDNMEHLDADELLAMSLADVVLF